MILSTQPSYCPPGASITTSTLVGTLDSEEENLKDENRGFLIMELCSFLEQIEKKHEFIFTWVIFNSYFFGGILN